MSPDPAQGGVRQPAPHDSAAKHTTGEAIYIDDLPRVAGQLFAAVGMSDRASARIVSLDLSPVAASPGVVAVIAAADIPGHNRVGPIIQDEELLATLDVHYAGQALFAVAAVGQREARQAARKALVVYEDREPVLTIDQAMELEAYVLPPHTMRQGDAADALATAPRRLQGVISTGAQDHFYLEGQVALALPGEDGDVVVHSSTQHPSEVQEAVAEVLGRESKDVTVEVRRMGGAFGGKESQATPTACLAAVLALRTGRAVTLRLDRDDDMILTGKRHEFRVSYDVGFDDTGRILGIEMDLAAACGWSADLSGPIADRAMFHSDNAYYLENVTLRSYRCRTNQVSATAFRGFGGPQGMMGIEQVMDDIARTLGMDPFRVRMANLYGVGERDRTPYGMTVTDNLLPELLPALAATATYEDRRREVVAFNREDCYLKKGLALTPVKFGISFTVSHLNQAGALLLVYKDGTVHLNHGGTEMGQGLYVKVAQVVAEEFGIDLDRIKITATTTGKVPNTSATAASSGTDLNGQAAAAAARTVKRRMAEVAGRLFDMAPEEIVFRDNRVQAGSVSLSFPELVTEAYMARVSLSSTGYYATPHVHYDREKASGRPFYYFAYGAAVSEVLVDTLTGEYRVTRVDVLHDAGKSINPAIDLGQVKGGFVQGMGWLTAEEVMWDDQGRLLTHSPSTYKIPTSVDVPEEFRVELMETEGNRADVIHKSKAVGEPPLMLAISVFHALRDAVAATGPEGSLPSLDAPATPERVLLAIDDLRNSIRD